MEIQGERLEGRFIARDNRFRVTVEVAGRAVAVHLPNSGRLGELLLPGRRVLLVARPGKGRKTGYDLSLVEGGRGWVSVDARLPNALVREALNMRRLVPLAGYSTVRGEVPFGHSRFDFLLEASGCPPCLLEVKSATLLVDGLARFPDAVTARGRRHVEELTAAVEAGYRGVVLFVVQRGDARGFCPHDESDPAFGRALRAAARQGVEVYACGCRVEPGWIAVEGLLPVYLERSGLPPG